MMNLYERFIGYSGDLVNNKDTVNIYKKLVPTFKKVGLYREQAGVLEKIYNINNDFKLYKTIGDIYLDKLDNKDCAKIAYNNYFNEFDKDFYYKYAKAFDIETDDESEDTDKTATLISDRYCCICYMVIYCYQRNEIGYVLQLQNYLQSIKAELIDYIEQNDLDMEKYFNDVQIINEYISSQFGNTKHHNDLNRFAIELNPKNEQPYVNILDDYIEYKNYDLAQEFYNNEYKIAFNLPSKNSISDICWFLSDKCNEFNDVFSAVKRQQDAINLELGELHYEE